MNPTKTWNPVIKREEKVRRRRRRRRGRSGRRRLVKWSRIGRERE